MDRQYDYLQDQEGFAAGWPATDQVPGQQQPHSSLPGQQKLQPGDQGFLDASNDRPASQEGHGISGRPAGMLSAELADEGKAGGGGGDGFGAGGSAGGAGAGGFAGKGVAGGASAGGGSASRGESSLARILSLDELSTGDSRFGRYAELDAAVGKAREGPGGGLAGGLAGGAGEGGGDLTAAGGGLPVVTVTGEERKKMVAALRDGRDRAR
ncbi:hypothetical protein CLOM_g22060 [Closterium sp. NIES-68]|nr:hypothetical protein CLOM_g22060 [Closterium sp. NIES-68]